VVNWDLCKTVINEYDYLNKYDKEAGYGIEPKGTYHEQECFILQRGFNYVIEISFYWEKKGWLKNEEDNITEYSFFKVK
jgi:hypothetical protein